MARKSKYHAPRRINIIIEAALHDEAVQRAEAFAFEGGFSEYVARLIAADRNRKGRCAIAAQPRALSRAA